MYKKHIFLLINDLDYPHHACRTSQNPPNLPNWPESSHCLLTKNDWILNRILLCQILEQIFCFGASFMTDSNVTLTDSIFEIGKAYVCGPREHPMSPVHTKGLKLRQSLKLFIYCLQHHLIFLYVVGDQGNQNVIKIKVSIAIRKKFVKIFSRKDLRIIL
jgi:hypothetical protein